MKISLNKMFLFGKSRDMFLSRIYIRGLDTYAPRLRTELNNGYEKYKKHNQLLNAIAWLNTSATMNCLESYYIKVTPLESYYIKVTQKDDKKCSKGSKVIQFREKLIIFLKSFLKIIGF